MVKLTLALDIQMMLFNNYTLQFKLFKATVINCSTMYKCCYTSEVPVVIHSFFCPVAKFEVSLQGWDYREIQAGIGLLVLW